MNQSAALSHHDIPRQSPSFVTDENRSIRHTVNFGTRLLPFNTEATELSKTTVWECPSPKPEITEVIPTVMLPPRPRSEETVALGLRETEADDTGARLRMELALLLENTPVPTVQPSVEICDPIAYASTMPPPQPTRDALRKTAILGGSYLAGSLVPTHGPAHTANSVESNQPRGRIRALRILTRAMAVVLTAELALIAVGLLYRSGALPL